MAASETVAGSVAAVPGFCFRSCRARHPPLPPLSQGPKRSYSLGADRSDQTGKPSSPAGGGEVMGKAAGLEGLQKQDEALQTHTGDAEEGELREEMNVLTEQGSTVKYYSLPLWVSVASVARSLDASCSFLSPA